MKQRVESGTPNKSRALPLALLVTVRLSGSLSDHVASNVGEHGKYESVSEYIRDLIRHDKDRKDRAAFEPLKAELTRAYAAPESCCTPLTAADVIARNRG